MKQFKFNSFCIILALSSTFFFSCSNNQENEAKQETSTAQSNNEEVDDAFKNDTIRVTLNSNDNMQFDMSVINVFEGQTVVLTLNHTGTMPVTAMGHNFVLLAQGASPSEFANKAMESKDNDYIPSDASNIIAHTALIGGGESDTITFEAPQKGEYDYLCSFPGHSSIMKGKLNVQ